VSLMEFEDNGPHYNSWTQGCRPGQASVFPPICAPQCALSSDSLVFEGCWDLSLPSSQKADRFTISVLKPARKPLSSGPSLHSDGPHSFHYVLGTNRVRCTGLGSGLPLVWWIWSAADWDQVMNNRRPLLLVALG
jgi:hypothetical protein